MTNEDAVKWLENLKSDIGKMQFQALWGYEQAIDEIIDLLSVETEWIPCSERLPEAEDMYQPPEHKYLCQVKTYGERQFYVLSRLKGAAPPFWDWYGVVINDSEVIAWRPLPEPYKERRE